MRINMRMNATPRVRKTRHRKATNLSLDTGLVKEAQELGLNLSRVLEAALQLAVKEERGRRWAEENRAAFEAANRAIDKYGIFNAEDREW
jgi:antitoxin CcdA